MVTYTVHEPLVPAEDLRARAEAVIFEKEGFAWPAFLAPVLWLAFKRMWLELILFLAALSVLAVAVSLLGGNETAMAWLGIAVNLIMGLEARDLRRWRLERHGYRMVAVVSGRSAEACERRFFTAWLPQAHEEQRDRSQLPPRPQALPAAGAPGEPVIGMFPQQGG